MLLPVEKAGAFAIVIEGVMSNVAQKITEIAVAYRLLV
jgi:ketopantoate hydroxymethyltransferase